MRLPPAVAVVAILLGPSTHASDGHPWTWTWEAAPGLSGDFVAELGFAHAGASECTWTIDMAGVGPGDDPLDYWIQRHSLNHIWTSGEAVPLAVHFDLLRPPPDSPKDSYGWAIIGGEITFKASQLEGWTFYGSDLGVDNPGKPLTAFRLLLSCDAPFEVYALRGGREATSFDAPHLRGGIGATGFGAADANVLDYAGGEFTAPNVTVAVAVRNSLSLPGSYLEGEVVMPGTRLGFRIVGAGFVSAVGPPGSYTVAISYVGFQSLASLEGTILGTHEVSSLDLV